MDFFKIINCATLITYSFIQNCNTITYAAQKKNNLLWTNNQLYNTRYKNKKNPSTTMMKWVHLVFNNTACLPLDHTTKLNTNAKWNLTIPNFSIDNFCESTHAQAVHKYGNNKTDQVRKKSLIMVAPLNQCCTLFFLAPFGIKCPGDQMLIGHGVLMM